MTPGEILKKEARLDAIRVQIDAIPAMRAGTLLVKRNRVRRLDGGVHVSPEHFTFQHLGLSLETRGKEYRFLKGLLHRIGAEAVVNPLQTRYTAALAAFPEAVKELHYIRKQMENMRDGPLRKNGLFIASGHVEAAARVLVVRRCKQAGMHWRHLNAIRISAILALLRSVA